MLAAIVAILGFACGAGAASVYGVLPFQNTGASPPSHYGRGSSPESSLLQASDGNFYGTTTNGGAGSCPLAAKPHAIVGCGTIYRINAATGIETVVFSFPYNAATETAPDGAYPTAGLIQGQDGALYGVAQDGGIVGCENLFYPSLNGCGTLFRISTAGVFTLLHQFCGTAGCPGVDEGANPGYHLVQTSDGTLYGTTSEGGAYGNGTLFSASTSGAVTTLFVFNNYNGGTPSGALLLGQDGITLYGVALDSLFSYGATGLTTIYSFASSDSRPDGELIFGPDGLLYGYTIPGGQSGALYSLSTTGGDYAVDATLPRTLDTTGLLLGSDGMIYGTMIGETQSDQAGGLFVYNPTTKVIRGLVQFVTASGGSPDGALIEGKDHYLYGSNAEGGPSNSIGPAEGTLFRIGPPLL